MIDPTKPVRLLRHIFKGGNSYHPGMYRPGELPEEYLIDGVVSQGENLMPGIVPKYSDLGATQTIDLTTTPATPAPSTFGDLPTPIVSSGAHPAPLPNTAPAQVPINTALVDRLTIAFGAIAANSIVELREAKPFANLVDLKKRVVVKDFDWDKFSSNIIF